MGHQDGQEIQIQQELIREGEQHRLHIILISHIEESENTSIIKQKKKGDGFDKKRHGRNKSEHKFFLN